MHTRIGLILAALLGAPACGVPDEPSEAGGGGAEDVPPALRGFEVSLDEATTAESVIPKILEAGRPELAATCADHPDEVIRIFSPIEPSAYADVACASVLSGGAAAPEQSAVPASEGAEPIGSVQQPWSPLGLGCGIFVLGSSLVASRAICPRARNQRDLKRCQNWSDTGFAGLSIMCAFL